MSKRRISEQQRKRISARQDRHVQHAQSHEELLALKSQTDMLEGLVVANLGRTVLLEADDGTLQQCHLRQNLPTLVPGDKVIWQQSNNQQEQVVVAVEPRRAALQRFSHKGEAKTVAANLDQLIIVFAANPPPHWTLIDRYIVFAHHFELTPLLVFNKVDLPLTDKTITEQVDVYVKLGYRVIKTSAQTSSGLDDFKAALKGKISSVVGQSGVGKSALASILLPNETIAIAADDDDDESDEDEDETATVTANSRLGKHTTTTARLYHVPDSGDLIDCPGVRVMHATGFSREIIQAGFKEIAAAAMQCKYRNCQHVHEPQCGVATALAEGEINARRWRSFLSMCEDGGQG